MKSLSDLSVADLRRVLALKEQIESLEGQLEAIREESSAERCQPSRDPRSRQTYQTPPVGSASAETYQSSRKGARDTMGKSDRDRHRSKETPHEHGGTRCHISRSQGAMGQSPCGKSLTL
jgi:hypothetical protein